MTDRPATRSKHSFRTFFLRGLGILLPTILTIWILYMVFSFVYHNIAAPINRGLRGAIVATGNPSVSDDEVRAAVLELTPDQRKQRQSAPNVAKWDRHHTRSVALARYWRSITVLGFPVLDLFGLLLAVMLIYAVGLVVGSFLGRGLYARAEELLQRVPFFKQVYPYVKQVTDFLVGGSKEKIQFNKVVAVEYPRKGIWSVGLMTGDTMQLLQDAAGKPCITVFIPSSPTPFTGYVLTVPVEDTIELPITLDDALRFVVSGGVIVPLSQKIAASQEPVAPALPAAVGASPADRDGAHV